jgi:hypothetical protein
MFIIAILFALFAALMIFLEVLLIGGIFGALAIMSCVGLGAILFVLHLPFTVVGQFGLVLTLVIITARYIGKSKRRKARAKCD